MSTVESNHLAERQKLYRAIEKERGSKVLAYVTSDRANASIPIARDVIDIFTEHLDKMFSMERPMERITLVLHTQGGDALAAWNLINLIRMFCDDIEVLVINKAHSAGTFMCLGANRVIMTKQATLSPIDPSLTSPLGPVIPHSVPSSVFSVSVEAVRSYIQFVEEKMHAVKERRLTEILIDLAKRVHPLVLGQIFRTEEQMRKLAEELLKHQIDDKKIDAKQKNRMIEFLTRKSGSHDYTLNRREAQTLGLEIEKPSQDFYDNVLKKLYTNLRGELELNTPFSPQDLLREQEVCSFKCVCGLVESLYESHAFIAEGTVFIVKQQDGQQQGMVNYDKKGWVTR